MKCPSCGFDMKFAGVVKQLRVNHPRAFQLWEPAEEDQLVKLAGEGKSVLEISRALGRHPSSVQKRLGLLGIEIAKVKPALKRDPDTPEWREFQATSGPAADSSGPVSPGATADEQ